MHLSVSARFAVVVAVPLIFQVFIVLRITANEILTSFFYFSIVYDVQIKGVLKTWNFQIQNNYKISYLQNVQKL